MFGALVPYRGTNVPVHVRNYCEAENNHVQFRRLFSFSGRKPYAFNSHMEHLDGDEIVEFVRFGLGIRMKLSVEDAALCYSTRGYPWRMGAVRLALPDRLFFGRGKIIERGIDEDQVDMHFTMVHPLFGTSFRYGGGFHILGNAVINRQEA